MEETNLESKLSIDKYLEEESEEKRLERERILGASTQQQTVLDKQQVQQLLKDCQVSAKQATKTKEDLGDYLDKMQEQQAKLLEKALGACERQYGGSAGHGATSSKKIICNCGPLAWAHIKRDSCPQ